MVSESVTTRVGVNVEKNSQRERTIRARGPHFLRWRSRPSTFRTTGLPKRRGSQAQRVLAPVPIRINFARGENTVHTEREGSPTRPAIPPRTPPHLPTSD